MIIMRADSVHIRPAATEIDEANFEAWLTRHRVPGFDPAMPESLHFHRDPATGRRSVRTRVAVKKGKTLAALPKELLVTAGVVKAGPWWKKVVPADASVQLVATSSRSVQPCVLCIV